MTTSKCGWRVLKTGGDTGPATGGAMAHCRLPWNPQGCGVKHGGNGGAPQAGAASPPIVPGKPQGLATGEKGRLGAPQKGTPIAATGPSPKHTPPFMQLAKSCVLTIRPEQACIIGVFIAPPATQRAMTSRG